MRNLYTFHAGEKAVQLRANEAGMAMRNAPVIADTIVGGAKSFIAQQFMVVLASVDSNGAVWSSVLYGRPGFMHTEDNALVHIDMPDQARDLTDPFWNNILHDATVGMLFIELGSRRRYRINGQVQRHNDAGITIAVEEAFPNCPKYIQKRQLRQMGEAAGDHALQTGTHISHEIASLIRDADTFFVASLNAEKGADASHRGGERGFVQIVNDHTLRVPDFHGNSLFNTLGNIETNPNAGICIPDFEGQQLLQLTGRARILWDQDDPHHLTGGTHRFWEFEVDQWLLRAVAQLDWEYLDASPYNPPAKRD